MSGTDIFISYSREDRAAARHFAECFEQEGFTVWWDAALHSGETFDEVIENELKAAHAVVVLWSPRSVASRWVRAEATLADRRNKLAPVIIEACDRPIIFELTHTADLSNWTGDVVDGAWRLFVHDLHRVVDRSKGGGLASDKPRSAPAAPEPSAARSYSHGGKRKGEGEGKGKGEIDKVDSLMLALSSLQNAISKTKAFGQAPADDDDDDDEESATQIYTGSGVPGGDEFHCLELTDGDTLEKRYVVGKGGLKIGRTAPADVVLADGRVSRTHCQVDLADGGLMVTDLASTNGTFVDDQRIKVATVIEPGAQVRVGNVTLTYVVRTLAEV